MAPWLQDTTDAIGLLLAVFAVAHAPLEARLAEDEMAIGDTLAVILAIVDAGLWIWHLVTRAKHKRL